jgi:hypothetical protein
MRIGYARVSTRDQNLEMQLDALAKAACMRTFTDKLSGTEVERPGLKEALSHLRESDTLVVWKLDRLGRSVKGLVDLVNGLEARKVHFQSVTDGHRHESTRRALLFPRDGEPSPDGARADFGARPHRTGGRPATGTGRRSKAPDDRQQGSGREEAFGQRHAAAGGGAQLGRVDSKRYIDGCPPPHGHKGSRREANHAAQDLQGFKGESGSLSARNGLISAKYR